MSAYRVLALIFIILFAVYYIELFGILRKTKTQYPEFWKEIGSPDIMSPNGQLVFLSYIFGRKGYPNNFDRKLRRKCIRVRFYLITGMAAFAILAFLINAHPQP